MIAYRKSPAEDVSVAIGYCHQMKSLNFIITLATVERILLIFKPVNAMLQDGNMHLALVLPLIDESVEKLEAMRDDDTFPNIWSTAMESFVPPEPKRIRRENTRYIDQVINCRMPAYLSSNSTQTVEDMRRVYISVVDQVTQELKVRFC